MTQPAAPANLRLYGEAFPPDDPEPVEGDTITLAWDASAISNLAGYKIYRGPLTGTYLEPVMVGNQLYYSMSDLASGVWYFKVAAVSRDWVEESVSAEYSINLSTDDELNELTVSWTATAADNIEGYKVYYGTVSGTYPNYIMARGAATSATIPYLANGVYYVTVAAVDYYGNESAVSNEVAFKFQ